MTLKRVKCMLCNIEKRPLYSFPKNQERFKLWLKAIDEENLLDVYTQNYIYNNARLCSSHFDSSAFVSSDMKRLISFAVPKPIKNEVTECSSIHCHPEMPLETTIETSASDWYDIELTPKIPLISSTPKLTSIQRSRVKQSTPKTRRILQLSALNRTLKRKINTFSRQISGLEDLKSVLSARQYEFILSQLKVAKLKDKRGSRWSSKDKAMALNIYLQSPSAYKILRRFFAFPSKTTLRRSTGQIAKNDGFCPLVQAALTEKAKNMSQNEKLCTLVFDEMAIKSYLNYNAALDIIDGFESCDREDKSSPLAATQALVFMIRGITKNWKQVIAYYFRAHSAPDFWLKNTILEIISKVLLCGFKVIATVCDQGPFNQSLYRSLGVTCETPFFFFDGIKIFALFDMPHLLKSVRNNLKKYDVTFKEVKDSTNGSISQNLTASWNDIEKFYDSDSKQRFRVAPRLTYKHIYARGLASMKVKLAAQVFSHSVAAGLCVYANTGNLSSRSLQTAEFVGTMNDLFDSMNSKNRFCKGYMSAVSDGTEHVDFWMKSLKWVESWKFIAPSGKVIKPASQKGLIITLNATIGIWKEVNKDISYLMTNRLNQDCIENTFSSIRRRGGFRDNPDCYEFRNAVRCVIVYSFLKKSNSNCENDIDCNLLEITNMDTNMVVALCDANDDEICNENVDVPLTIDEVPTPTTTDIEDNVIAYIAGFLAKKYLKKYSCEECQNLLVAPKILDRHTLLLYFKEYNLQEEQEYGLKWPTNEFYSCMREMSERFFRHINDYVHKPDVRKNMSSVIRNVDFDFLSNHVHKNEAKDFFVFAFVTMMIKHKVRIENGKNYLDSINKSQNKKLKYVKHL